MVAGDRLCQWTRGQPMTMTGAQRLAVPGGEIGVGRTGVWWRTDPPEAAELEALLRDGVLQLIAPRAADPVSFARCLDELLVRQVGDRRVPLRVRALVSYDHGDAMAAEPSILSAHAGAPLASRVRLVALVPDGEQAEGVCRAAREACVPCATFVAGAGDGISTVAPVHGSEPGLTLRGLSATELWRQATGRRQGLLEGAVGDLVIHEAGRIRQVFLAGAPVLPGGPSRA